LRGGCTAANEAIQQDPAKWLAKGAGWIAASGFALLAMTKNQ